MRSIITGTLLCTLLPLGACKKEKPEAPTEMTDLLSYIFENFEDPDALGAATDNLAPWLDDNAQSEEIVNGYQMEPLAEATASAVDYPADAVIADQLGAVTGTVSSWSLDDQSHVMLQDDQTFLNADSYIRYNREVSGDTSTFTSGEGVIRTDNDVETKVVVWSTPYNLKKDYRWVEGEDSRAIVARSWIEKEGCNDGAVEICLLQSFSVDVFMEEGDKTQRLTATWAQVIPDVLTDKQLVDQLIDGVQIVFESEDTWMSENR